MKAINVSIFRNKNTGFPGPIGKFFYFLEGASSYCVFRTGSQSESGALLLYDCVEFISFRLEKRRGQIGYHIIVV